MKRIIRSSIISVLIFLLVVLSAFAQGSFKIGKYDFIIASSSGALQQAMAGSQGISYKFATSVGGVAFSGVAHPDISLKNRVAEISYDPTQPDGARLVVSIDGSIYHPPIPDWQLIPILKYADSKYDACVSLFGPNSNEQFYDIVYHPALNNTLLGLRLLQADILLMDLNEFWKLPKFADKTIMGYGENEKLFSKEFNIEKKVEEISNISKVFENEKYKSWILTDYALDISFKLENDNIYFSNFPYFYFWNDDTDRQRNYFLTRKNNYISLVKNYYVLLDKLKNLSINRQISESQAEELRKVFQDKRAEIDRAKSELETLAKKTPSTYPIPSLINKMKSQKMNLEEYNPVVYNAIENTMYFSSFFRFIKSHNAENWSKIKTQIKNVKIEPSVTTPTMWKKTKRR